MRLMQETLGQITPILSDLADTAQARLDQLTKPQGSLGRLEDIARCCVMITGHEHPQVTKKVLFVFCGDHGVAAEGVSAYPREVTAQMVLNCLHGGAAISVLARQLGIDVKIVDVGVDADFSPEQPEQFGFINKKIGRGTANFTRQPAMTQEAAVRAIEVGIALTTEAIHNGAQLIGAGEMGIGNTTSATALLCALSGFSPEELTGVGTGIHEEARQKKIAVIRTALALYSSERADALALHTLERADPLGILAHLGGYEIAAMVGVYLAGAAQKVPLLVDGFIATSAAWIACDLNPAVKGHLLFAHCSAEQGHQKVLNALHVQPLLDLKMRLGEGTGAALGMSIVESAVRLYNEMATFAEAAVSEKA